MSSFYFIVFLFGRVFSLFVPIYEISRFQVFLCLLSLSVSFSQLFFFSFLALCPIVCLFILPPFSLGLDYVLVSYGSALSSYVTLVFVGVVGGLLGFGVLRPLTFAFLQPGHFLQQLHLVVG